MFLNYTVKKQEKINLILKNELQISSRLLYKLIKNKLVYLDGKTIDTRTLANVNDTITIDLNYNEENSNIVATKIDLNIIYEDEAFIVLNKPSGIAVHPSILHFEDTLSNGIKYHFDQINLHKKIRPVNRLDFYTSGLIVFAKNEYIQESLIKQMKEKIFKKEYLALVHGNFTKKQGIINKPIARKENSIIERCISENGKPSITHFKVVQEYEGFSLVKCILETGRTHQIRVHMSSIGHPLVGDTLYSSKTEPFTGQALSCIKLQFNHPISNTPLTFTQHSLGFQSYLSSLKQNE